MGKTLTTRNQAKFYIRREYIPVWLEFLKLIKKDRIILEQKEKLCKDKGGAPGIISIAVINLVYNYVIDNNPGFMDQLKDNQGEDDGNIELVEK
jgi:hypothetical protein